MNIALNRVKEGAPGGANIGDLVGITAHASDPNSGPIIYSILSDSSQGGFAIDGKSGVVSVKDPGKLDYESAADHQYKVMVKATDSDGLFSVRTFAIAMLDVIEPLDLDDLPVGAGYRIVGSAASDSSGASVAAAGDVNDDGIGDFIVGAPLATVNNRNEAGAAYVIFGKKDGGSIDLANLGPGEGFRIDGAKANERWGSVVSAAGDVNGDGRDDIIVSTYRAAPGGKVEAGSSAVIFGKSGDFANIDLSASLPAATGFRINGGVAGDRSGSSLAAAGDVNGDGFDDLVIGAPGGGDAGSEGLSYVILGKASFSTMTLSAALASSFCIAGIGKIGSSVANAGDVNGDGYKDLIVGAPYASPSSRFEAGSCYVLFGRNKDLVDLDLSVLSAKDGFRIDGAVAEDRSGLALATAGDVNGDGFDDIIIGAMKADPKGRDQAGSSYVLFGHDGGFTAIDLAVMGANDGFRIDGAVAGDRSGGAVAAAGDINGDGFDDIIIGASGADPQGGVGAGVSYVIYGRSDAFGSIDLANLPASAGFRIDGAAAADASGAAIAAAGDVNGDGYDDIMIGAPGADASGKDESGATYIIFGGDFSNEVTHQGTSGINNLIGSAAVEVMIGGVGDDVLSGGGGADVIKGGSGNDVIHVGDLAFFRIDGGGGMDHLVFDCEGGVDLSNIDGNAATSDRGRIQGIEILDFVNAKVNTITLRLADLLDLNVGNHDVGGKSQFDNTLRIEGDATDALHLCAEDGWSAPNKIIFPGYWVYSKGTSVELAVNPEINITMGP